LNFHSRLPLLLTWPRQCFSGKPLPSTRNLFPRERLRLGFPRPLEQTEIDVVFGLDAQVDKSHWEWHVIELQDGVCSYIARKAGRVPRGNSKRRLPNGPLYQSFYPVVVVVEELLALPVALELLFCHIAKKLNILKIKDIAGISYRYGEVKP
jgi:hypothetical protein